MYLLCTTTMALISIKFAMYQSFQGKEMAGVGTRRIPLLDDTRALLLQHALDMCAEL